MAILNQLVAAVEEQTTELSSVERLAYAVDTASQLLVVREHLIGHFVEQARNDGASWAEVGRALGVTKQSAQVRFLPYGARPELVAVTTKLTDRARRVLDRAATGGGTIDATDLVCALGGDPDGLAARVLSDLGVSIPRVRRRSRQASPELDDSATAALHLALREAHALGHNYIGTEHLLLGLAVLPEERLHAALSAGDVDVDRLRTVIIREIAASAPSPRRRRRQATGG